MELIKEIGALAGLCAFLGLAVLTLLYFSQARDVRRLRDWAGRAPERDAEGVEATSDLAATAWRVAESEVTRSALTIQKERNDAPWPPRYAWRPRWELRSPSCRWG